MVSYCHNQPRIPVYPYLEACASADGPTISDPLMGNSTALYVCMYVPRSHSAIKGEDALFLGQYPGTREPNHINGQRGWNPTRRAHSCSAMRCCYERAPRATRMLNNDCHHIHPYNAHSPQPTQTAQTEWDQGAANRTTPSSKVSIHPPTKTARALLMMDGWMDGGGKAPHMHPWRYTQYYRTQPPLAQSSYPIYPVRRRRGFSLCPLLFDFHTWTP